MKLIIFISLLATSRLLDCNGKLITECKVCHESDPKCVLCNRNFLGPYCNICVGHKFLLNYLDSYACIDCVYSNCNSCDGTKACGNCPGDVESSDNSLNFCDSCKSPNKFLMNRKCINCADSPCGLDGVCDGSNICVCNNNKDCCGENSGSIYEVNDAGQHICSLCTVPGCGSCPSFDKIDCVRCIDGSMPIGNDLGRSCLHVFEYSESNFNWLWVLIAILFLI